MSPLCCGQLCCLGSKLASPRMPSWPAQHPFSIRPSLFEGYMLLCCCTGCDKLLSFCFDKPNRRRNCQPLAFTIAHMRTHRPPRHARAPQRHKSTCGYKWTERHAYFVLGHCLLVTLTFKAQHTRSPFEFVITL